MSGFATFMSSIIGDVMAQGGVTETNQANLEAVREQDKFNADQAAINRNWSTGMMGSEMQIRVGDLKRAGLNPALAYQLGGASPISGPMASSAGLPNLQNPSAAFGNLGSQTANAMGLRAQDAQIDNLEASADKMRAESGQEIPAQVEAIKADANLSTQRASEVKRNVDMLDIALAPGGIAAVPGSMYANRYYAETQLAAARMQIANMDATAQSDTLQSLIKARNDENFALAAGWKNVYNASDGEFGRIMAFFKLGAPAISSGLQAAGTAASFVP